MATASLCVCARVCVWVWVCVSVDVCGGEVYIAHPRFTSIMYGRSAVYLKKEYVKLKMTRFILPPTMYSINALYLQAFEGLNIKNARNTNGNGAVTEVPAARSVLIRSCVISDNEASNGGAVHNSGNLYIRNSVFEKNKATICGGAIYTTLGQVRVRALPVFSLPHVLFCHFIYV